MKPTDLEKHLLIEFFRIRGGNQEGLVESLDEIAVTDRVFTGAGFFTDFQIHDCLKVARSDESYQWGGGIIGGTLNGAIHVGFEFYVDEGHLTTIEGFTYSAPAWPDRIDSFRLFKEGYADGKT
jgi:hypothetical protein